MSAFLDRLILACLGAFVLVCVAALLLIGVVCWWLAYAGYAFGLGQLFTALCLLICGACGYALVMLCLLFGRALRQAVLGPPAVGGGPGL